MIKVMFSQDKAAADITAYFKYYVQKEGQSTNVRAVYTHVLRAMFCLLYLVPLTTRYWATTTAVDFLNSSRAWLKQMCLFSKRTFKKLKHDLPGFDLALGMSSDV